MTSQGVCDRLNRRGWQTGGAGYHCFSGIWGICHPVTCTACMYYTVYFGYILFGHTTSHQYNTSQVKFPLIRSTFRVIHTHLMNFYRPLTQEGYCSVHSSLQTSFQLINPVRKSLFSVWRRRCGKWNN